MKHNKKYTLLVLLASLIFLPTGCKKDFNDAETKEAVTYKLTEDISSDSIRAFVSWLQDMKTRFALADNHREIAVKIRNRFSGMNYTDTRLDSFEITRVFLDYSDSVVKTFEQWQYNVVATLNPSSQADSVCIIGAHYDDITSSSNPFYEAPGANDNASGVAAAMEIARVMKLNNYHPSGKIKFIAFGSEELGLFGSYSYAARAANNNEPVKLMLNNDMIAFEPRNDRSQWKVNIIDYDNSHTIRQTAESLCSKYTILTSYNDNTYSGSSDSYPFFENGFKALFFFSDIFDPDYHSTNDVASHCNFEYCSEIVRLNCAILVDQN
jgi:hypothetical protein